MLCFIARRWRHSELVRFRMLHCGGFWISLVEGRRMSSPPIIFVREG